MIYDERMRTSISEQCKGKKVDSLEYEAADEETGPYWVMTFDDGSEICFRFMAELVGK